MAIQLEQLRVLIALSCLSSIVARGDAKAFRRNMWCLPHFQPQDVGCW